MRLVSTPSRELAFHTLDSVLPWTLPPQGAHHSSDAAQGRHSNLSGCLGACMGSLNLWHPHCSIEHF